MSEANYFISPQVPSWDVLGLTSTAGDGVLIATALSLPGPEDMIGKRVIDIGSGFSGLVPMLTEAGAEAIGIDPGYAEPTVMLEKLLGHLSRATASIESIEREVKVAEDTVLAIKNKGATYLAADSRFLPFKANYFDLATSFCMLGQINPDTDPEASEFIRTSLIEALRVLKPGCSLKIGPRVREVHSDYRDGGFKRIFKELEDTRLISAAKEISVRGMTQSLCWELVKDRKAGKRTDQIIESLRA